MSQKKLNKRINSFITSLTPLTLSRFLFYAFIFLLPFQINLVVYTSSVFETGNFNHFTSIFIYFTDFVLLFALLFWAIAIIKKEYTEKLTYGSPFIFIVMFLFLIAAEVSVLFAQDQWLTFSLVLRLLQFTLMYFFIVNKVISLEKLINVFLASVVVQGVIAVTQYVFQSSVGLGMLGESHIGPDVPGVAKIDTVDGKIIRPYGTLPHPNILAGYMLTGIFLAYYRIRQNKKWAFVAMIILLSAFILAFSRGAFLAFVIAALVYFSVKESKVSIKYILLFLAFLIFFIVLFNLEQTFFSRLLFSDSSSLDERVMYFNISKRMFFDAPFGVGLGNFTFNLPDFTSLKLAPWQFQPVHNAYMLILNELGIIGGFLFVLLFGGFSVGTFVKMNKLKGDLKILGRNILAILVSLFVIGMFDHYTVSLYHGIALLFVVFAIAGRYMIKEIHL